MLFWVFRCRVNFMIIKIKGKTGGVALYILNQISYTLKSDICIKDDDSLWIDILFPCPDSRNPWITSSILNSIAHKDELFTR
uniref:Cytosolic sorting protein/ADP-ribosylation factor effector GGA n=1 Tax=Cyriopagopus schmidti TaxID=29017 RepID=B5M6D6_CYRSC|nr:cytosolic sorting protein/ADP-ribosylation factor effector GGA [Cyriopagopus schmidti]